MTPQFIFLIIMTMVLGRIAVAQEREEKAPAFVISPEGSQKPGGWTWQELSQNLAKRQVSQSQDTTRYLIRLQGAEKPHIHKTHDLVVFVLEGEGLMHFSERRFAVKAGDVVEIPQGMPHWAQNTGNGAMTAYAVFSPPDDGTDCFPLETRADTK